MTSNPSFFRLLITGAILAIPAIVIATFFRRAIARLAPLIGTVMVLAIVVMVGGCAYCLGNNIDLATELSPTTFTLLSQSVPIFVGFLGTFGILGIPIIGKVSFD